MSEITQEARKGLAQQTDYPHELKDTSRKLQRVESALNVLRKAVQARAMESETNRLGREQVHVEDLRLFRESAPEARLCEELAGDVFNCYMWLDELVERMLAEQE